MGLKRYHEKRDFRRTAEPSGHYNAAAAGCGYIIQKHDARRLHYDFRLQVGGVLKSWAVPKGPSLDPKAKRLAVQTEDHPLDYADFEGTIPPDNYGAGTVMLWDRGEWQPLGDAEKGLAEGKLVFELHGERLRGRWALIKMKGKRRAEGEWLLVKEGDEFATSAAEPTNTYHSSVATGRTMSAIAKGDATDPVDEKLGQLQDVEAAQSLGSVESSQLKQAESGATSPAKIDGAEKAPMPVNFKPQLASLYKSVPDTDDWLHEIKYDGYRLLAQRQGSGEVKLLTRNNTDWTRKFPTIAQALRAMPEAIIDGELVYLDEQGISRFEKLQGVIKSGDASHLAFYAFDLPYFDGFDLTSASLLDRKALLAQVVQAVGNKAIIFSDHFRGNGTEVWQHACAHGLEGIVSKHVASTYESTRTRSWRKAKCGKRQEFLIIGFTAPKNSRSYFGALLLGYWNGDKLCYAGKVGTGFNQEQLKSVYGLLHSLRQKRPTVDEPVDDTRSADVTWVKPELVAEVEFTEWTSANRLRHPAFVELRADKAPKDIVREVPQDVGADTAGERPTKPRNTRARSESSKDLTDQTASGSTAGKGRGVKIAGVTLTSPNKQLYEQAMISKRDLAEYYVDLADWILPHIQNRPLTLVRCPQGHKRHCFFQKHLGESFDPAVQRMMIVEKQGQGSYAYIKSIQGLVGLVQMGTLEIHAWGSRIDAPDKPDVLVFDLDPDEGVSWDQIKEGARVTREFLHGLGLQSFLRTSGGKGLHVVVPLTRRHTWDEAKNFSRRIAQALAHQYPERYVATASKAKRRNKIFIDYLRNSRGATSVCTFSTRSRPGAPVATPLAWSELDSLESPQAYQLGNIRQRLANLQGDPWTDYGRVRQSITREMKQRLNWD